MATYLALQSFQTCPYCQNQIHPTAHFCPRCGSSVPTSYAPYNYQHPHNTLKTVGKVTGKIIKWQIVVTLLCLGVFCPFIWIGMLLWFVVTRCIGAGVRLGTMR